MVDRVHDHVISDEDSNVHINQHGNDKVLNRQAVQYTST